MIEKYKYDNIYKKHNTFFLKRIIHKNELDVLIKKLNNGKVLDLGVGVGAESIYLAKKGFDITAIDISKFGLIRLQDIAKQKNLSIRTIVADLENYVIDEFYDGIISFYTIQFLNKKRIDSLIKNIKKNTKKGGINIIAVFREGDSTQKKSNYYFFKDGMLKGYYKNWKIISYNEKEILDDNYCKPHIHKIAIVIAENNIT